MLGLIISIIQSQFPEQYISCIHVFILRQQVLAVPKVVTFMYYIRASSGYSL